MRPQLKLIRKNENPIEPMPIRRPAWTIEELLIGFMLIGVTVGFWVGVGLVIYHWATK